AVPHVQQAQRLGPPARGAGRAAADLPPVVSRAPWEEEIMSTRDEILERVRRNQPPAIALPALPSFAAGPGPLLERFKAGVLRMGGKVADPPADGDLAALVA